MHYIYLIQCGVSQYYKIGVAEDVAARQAGLQIGCPYKLSVLMVCGFNSRTGARQAELQLHNRLNGSLVQGEWFKLNGGQLATLKHDMITNSE